MTTLAGMHVCGEISPLPPYTTLDDELAKGPIPNTNPNPNPKSSGGEWFPKFMGDHDDHFKFLGKGLVKDMSDSYAKMLVKQKFNSYTALMNGTLLSGIEKLWLWDNVAMIQVSWDFFIHDFPPSFRSKELQSIQTKYRKKCSGLAVL